MAYNKNKRLSAKSRYIAANVGIIKLSIMFIMYQYYLWFQIFLNVFLSYIYLFFHIFYINNNINYY